MSLLKCVLDGRLLAFAPARAFIVLDVTSAPTPHFRIVNVVALPFTVFRIFLQRLRRHMMPIDGRSLRMGRFLEEEKYGYPK